MWDSFHYVIRVGHSASHLLAQEPAGLQKRHKVVCISSLKRQSLKLVIMSCAVQTRHLLSFKPTVAEGEFLSKEPLERWEVSELGVVGSSVRHTRRHTDTATAGPHGGNTGGRLCGQQLASPPGTG